MQTTLIELLSEKKLSEITVTELAKKAGISRMTFYRNYSSVEALLESYAAWIFTSYHRKVASARQHGSFIKYENVLLGFEYFKEYNGFYTCLKENRKERI